MTAVVNRDDLSPVVPPLRVAARRMVGAGQGGRMALVLQNPVVAALSRPSSALVVQNPVLAPVSPSPAAG